MTLLWTQGMRLFFETLKWNIILTLKGQLICHIILCSQRGKKSMNLIISLSRRSSISKINFRCFGFIAHWKYCHTKNMGGCHKHFESIDLTYLHLHNYWFFLSLFWHFIWFHLTFITVEMLGLRVCFYCLGRAIIELVYYLSIRSSRLDSSMLKWFSVNLFFQRFPGCSFFPSWDVNWVVTLDIRCQ